MVRAGLPVGVAAASAVLVLWVGVKLWSVSSRVETTGAALADLSARVDAGLAALDGKLDLALSRLGHMQPGGFHDKSPRGAHGGGSDFAEEVSRSLQNQMQRLTQGVAKVDDLKQELDRLIPLIQQGTLAADKSCTGVLRSACSGHGGGGGGAAESEFGNKVSSRQGRDADGGGGAPAVRHGGERGLKSEFDFGLPANHALSPPDNHNEALWQQTLRMSPGDPLPMVGNAYHPWWSNSDHSRNPTYVHLLKDKYGAKRKCKYVDVIFWHKEAERCALIVPDREIKSRIVEAELDMETGVAKPRPVVHRDTTPLDIKPRDERYWAFAQAKDEMVEYLRHLVGTHERRERLKKQANPEPLVVMCANDGHLGLLLNWACSLREAGIDMPRHVIFVTTAKTRDFLKAMGFTAYYHAKMGSYPAGASKKYSDMDFGKMMILKQVAVALSLESGYDVLFQDIDITWIKDPRPELVEQSKHYEVQFQDDGARNRLYQPWSANTGFFYMRATYVARDFWDRVTQSMPSWPQSNQVLLNYVLDNYAKRGHPINNAPFPIRILPQDTYVAGNGVDLPGARNPGQASVHFDVRPLSPTVKVVHFCWTHNITFKIEKMKAYNSLFVTDDCVVNHLKCLPEGTKPDEGWADKVCHSRDPPPLASSYGAWLKAH